MTDPSEMNPGGSILAIIHAINQAWLHSRLDEMTHHFDERIVFAMPGFVARSEGRDACVKSYADFMSMAKVHDYKESNHVVDVLDDTAIATYRFEITYEMNGVISTEVGHDLFVFRRTDNGWKAVWRTMIAPTAV